MNDHGENADFRRLKWRCRRAMLELDIVLNRFIEGPQFGQLDLEGRIALDRFLDESDAEIWAWIQGAKSPPREFELIIKNI